VPIYRDDDGFSFVLDQQVTWNFIVLSHANNSQCVGRHVTSL